MLYRTAPVTADHVRVQVAKESEVLLVSSVLDKVDSLPSASTAVTA